MLHKLTCHALLLLSLAACTGSAPEEPGGPVTDLGLRNYSHPEASVHCSGQPTEAQFAKLREAGITRVVHLRKAEESGSGWEEQKAAEAGIEFVRLEVDGADGLTRENVERFSKLMDEARDGDTLVSCGSSNRVGALFALEAAWIDGKSKEEALAVGRAAGLTRLQSKVEELLDR